MYLALVPLYAAAIFGLLGASLQSIASGMAVVGLFVVIVEALLQLGLFLYSNPELGPDAPPETSADHSPASAPDQTALALRKALDESRASEAAIGKRYEAGIGAAEDVIRAKAIRLKAEIDLIRHESVTRVPTLAAR